MPKKLVKPKDVKGRVELLKVMPYRGWQTYLLRFDKDLFVWLTSKSEVFLGHLVVTPGKDGKPLTESQIAQAGATAFAGATATVDGQMDKPNQIIENAKENFKKMGEKVMGNNVVN